MRWPWRRTPSLLPAVVEPDAMVLRRALIGVYNRALDEHRLAEEAYEREAATYPAEHAAWVEQQARLEERVADLQAQAARLRVAMLSQPALPAAEEPTDAEGAGIEVVPPATDTPPTGARVEERADESPGPAPTPEPVPLVMWREVVPPEATVELPSSAALGWPSRAVTAGAPGTDVGLGWPGAQAVPAHLPDDPSPPAGTAAEPSPPMTTTTDFVWVGHASEAPAPGPGDEVLEGELVSAEESDEVIAAHVAREERETQLEDLLGELVAAAEALGRLRAAPPAPPAGPPQRPLPPELPPLLSTTSPSGRRGSPGRHRSR